MHKWASKVATEFTRMKITTIKTAIHNNQNSNPQQSKQQSATIKIAIPLDCHRYVFHLLCCCDFADQDQILIVALTKVGLSGEWCPLLQHAVTGVGNPPPLQNKQLGELQVTLPLGTLIWKRCV